MTIKTITIKKKGGGTRKQLVKVLKSGKYKFIKNTSKITKAVKRTSKAVKRKSSKTKKTKSAKKSTNKRYNNNNGMKLKIPGIAKKLALGIGGATLATAIISLIMPNSSVAKFAGPAGAYALGGIEGVIGSLALNMVGNRSASPVNVVGPLEAL